MGRSSITCSIEQRDLIDELKRELAIALGRKSRRDITDREFVQILLDTYIEHKNKSILSLARELTNQLEGIISLLNIAEDYEKLKQENEELRKEIEILKERANEYRVPEEPKEIFNLFIKSILKKIPEERRREVERSLRMLQFAIFDGGINVDLLERLGDHVDELVLTIRTGRSSKDSDESELRGGIQLW